MQAIYARHGIQLFYLKLTMGHCPTHECSGVDAMEQLCLQLEPDIIHIQSFSGENLPAIIKMPAVLNVRKIITLHTHALFCLNGTCFNRDKICQVHAFRQCECGMAQHHARQAGLSVKEYNDRREADFRDIVNLSGKIICCSHWQESRIRQLYGQTDKLATLHYGVTLPVPDNLHLSRPKRRKPCFGYLGSLSHFKGVGTFIRAISSLDQKKFTVIVAILFNNIHSQDFKYYVNLLKKMPAVKLITLTKKEHYYRLFFSKIDALIVPSLWEETGPMTLFESFFYQTPVIVSRRASMLEKVKESRNAMVFNTDIDLAHILQNIINGDSLPFQENNFDVKSVEQYIQEVNDIYMQKPLLFSLRIFLPVVLSLNI